MKYPLRDYIPRVTYIFLCRLKQVVGTAISRIYGHWWNIKIGKQSKFFGIPIFRRHPTACVVIGDYCQFRSAEWSNTIGLNHRCVVSASHGAVITIGNNCGFSGTVIAANESITIGHRVLCGGNCTIVDTDRHPVDSEARARNEVPTSEPIIIEDDVFLSMNVVVLKGCTIGKNTIVAANSVVTGSLPANVIAGGVPAKVIRSL